MEYQISKIKYPIYMSRAFQLYFKDMNIGILDIETTGLSPKNSAFILGGLLTPETDGLKVEQFFAEDLSQEQDALNAFWNAVSEKNLLITFNGHHFDIPFMQGRFSSDTKDFPFNLDLYLLVKNYSPIRKFLPNLKQKTIENYMGLWQYRKDEISGKESVDMYYRFLTEKAADLKDKILLHNHDDIVQLYRLLKVIEKTDIHKAMFLQGFPVICNNTELIVEQISLKQEQLRIRGRQRRNALQYQGYNYNGVPCYTHFSKEAGSFSIDIPVIIQFGLVLIDLDSLGIPIDELDKYPSCHEGFLILQKNETVNYLEINHFIKIFIERILTEWTTNR